MHNVQVSELASLPLATLNPSSSLSTGIKDSLRNAILSGALPPGYRLREAPLAAHFQVSSTPVREALRNLENEGLITFYPRRGAVVSEKTTVDVRNLYEVRIVLECYAARAAAARYPDSAALRPVQALLDQQQAWTQHGRPAAQPPIDADFHRELALLAGNPELAAIIERATRQIEAVQARYKAMIPNDVGIKSAATAHAALLEKVAAGDAEGAERAMRDHLESAREMVTAVLAQSGVGTR